MSVTELAATLAVVNDNAGTRIKQRRDDLNLSVAEVAERAELDKGVVYRLEAGKRVRPTSARAIERALDDLEREQHEHGVDVPSVVERVRPVGDPEAGLVSFDLKGPAAGFSVVVKGPVENFDLLEASALRMIEKWIVSDRDID